VTGPVSPEPGLVLVVNTGSSSLKLRVLDRDDLVTAAADIAPPPGGGIADVINDFLERAPKPDAAGHRVVHGGAEFTAPVLLDAASEERLSRLQDLAPLHNRPALEAIRALQRLRPALPSVACFDTSFHASLPAAAATYALPAEWNQRWGLRLPSVMTAYKKCPLGMSVRNRSHMALPSSGCAGSTPDLRRSLENGACRAGAPRGTRAG